MYETLTPDEITARMAARMGSKVSVREGTFGDLFCRAAGYELWRFYQQLDKLIPIAFVDETSGPYLAARAAEFGLTRKAGGAATVLLTFHGAPGASIPAGTAAMTAGGLLFLTSAAAVTGADGTAQAPAQAEKAGSCYNVGAGYVSRLYTAVSGVQAVENRAAAAGGYDEETDAELFLRLCALRQKPATSGNCYQYQQWALSVEGVGAARVVALWDGPGTVKVVLAGSDMLPVSDSVCAACADYIESVRPVGAAVTVQSATGVTIRVQVKVALHGAATIEQAAGAFAKALREYLHSVAFTGAPVVYSRVAYHLMGVDGVSDYADLTLNGGTDNVSLADDELPVLGEVEVKHA